MISYRCMLRGFRLHRCPSWFRPSITVSDHNGILWHSCSLFSSLKCLMIFWAVIFFFLLFIYFFYLGMIICRWLSSLWVHFSCLFANAILNNFSCQCLTLQIIYPIIGSPVLWFIIHIFFILTMELDMSIK